MENPDFLKQKYNLHTTPEVESAVKRTETRTEEKVSQNPVERIQNYLDRFKEIIDRDDPDKRERGIEALKRVLHDKILIKPEEVPESTFLLEQRIAREQGHGEVEITDGFRERKIEQVINNQTQSLDKWVDYLSSDDANYPDWAKYWAFRSMLEMGRLQKEEDGQGRETARFQKRTKDTTASFPPLNPRALALAIGVLRSRLAEKEKPKNERGPVENQSIKLDNREFQELLSTENFSKIYAQFLIEMPEYSTEGLKEIRGEWVKYEQGSDASALVRSLEGYPLEWCTADYDTAQGQLKGGDFYVYYSFNEAGEAIIPRLAIRMENDQIAEDPRGIATDQNLDPYITPVLEAKLQDFGPQADVYKKKSHDMKLLTEIEMKNQAGQELTRNDLIFLYEIDSTIEGFGYDRDPRIDELRSARDPKVDMPILFECLPSQIAISVEEITAETKAYVGALVPGIFQILPDELEHVYTSFPEKKIRRENVEVGGKSAEELILEMKAAGILISDYAMSMLRNSREFVPGKSPEDMKLVRLTVADLGFNGYITTTDKVYKRAEELGLELCPPDTGPHYLLKYKDQPMNELVLMGMKQITGSNGNPHVFYVGRGDGSLWLGRDWAEPGSGWVPHNTFVFRFRKSES